MPDISFKKHSKTGHWILRYNCHDGRLEYYTGQRGEDKGTVSVLNRMRSVIQEMEIDFKVKGAQLTKAAVRQALDRVLHKQIDHSAMAKLTTVIDNMEAGRIVTPQNKKYSAGSIKTFRFTVDLLERFGDATPTMANYSRFITWCQDKEYSTNYIGSQLKNWKALARHAGIHVPAEFKKIVEETHDIYLDEDDLKAMNQPALELSDREALVRDWFLLDCYTGLRVSDLVQLKAGNLSGEFITIANKKTGEKVVLPVHPVAAAILARYGGQFPHKITDVEINRVIKTVAKKAGIKGRILFTITKGGKQKDEYLEKWQMISCHTARRSFITNLRKNGVPDSIVMKLTGIRSSATLRRYDKLSQEEAARIAAGMQFFKDVQKD